MFDIGDRVRLSWWDRDVGNNEGMVVNVVTSERGDEPAYRVLWDDPDGRLGLVGKEETTHTSDELDRAGEAHQ